MVAWSNWLPFTNAEMGPLASTGLAVTAGDARRRTRLPIASVLALALMALNWSVTPADVTTWLAALSTATSLMGTDMAAPAISGRTCRLRRRTYQRSGWRASAARHALSMGLPSLTTGGGRRRAVSPSSDAMGLRWKMRPGAAGRRETAIVVRVALSVGTCDRGIETRISTEVDSNSSGVSVRLLTGSSRLS